jgi:hypothetical protein
MATTKFCRHIHTNGERCGSPALRSEAFCYFHVDLGKRHRRLRSSAASVQTVLHPMTLQDGSQRSPILAEPEPLPLDLPPLEDRQSIQVALSLLITAVARNQIDPKRAALLFYGLQVASSNARDLNPVSKLHKRPSKVSETILDEASGELIAPDQDPEDDDSSDYERPGTATRFLKQIEAEERERDRTRADVALAAAAKAAGIELPLPLHPGSPPTFSDPLHPKLHVSDTGVVSIL